MKRALICASILLIAGTAVAVTPGTDQYLPSVGAAVGTAPWYTTVWVYNPDSSPAIVNFYLLKRQANPAPASFTDTIQPGDVKRYDDAVQFMFNQPVFGALRIVSDRKVVVSSRIYSKALGGQDRDSKGQYFGGILASFAIGAGETTQIIGAKQTSADKNVSDFRFNVGVVETTGNPATVSLKLLDETGAQVGSTKIWPVGARQQKQDSISTLFGVALSNGRIEVGVSAGSGKVIAFGSSIANGSDDPSTVEMTFASGGGATPTTGRFEGVSGKLTDTVLGDVDGGIRVVIGASSVTEASGVAGIQCTTGPYTLDWAIPTANITLNGDGSFSGTFAQPYTDGVSSATIFTTTWTLAGARNADGTYGGTLKATTAGGTGQWAECNDSAVSTRLWRAGWTGNS